jgi:hypothetical protein
MRNFFNKNLLRYDYNALFENLLLILAIGFTIAGLIGVFTADNPFSLIKNCCIVVLTLPIIAHLRGSDV